MNTNHRWQVSNGIRRAGGVRRGAKRRPGEVNSPTRGAGQSERRAPCGKNSTPTCLGPWAVLALSLNLAGCGGGESGPGISGATPSPGTATYHDVSTTLPPGEYAFSGALRDAVRIGIEDSPVDFTHPVFHGRIQLEGAEFAYWRPLAGQRAQHAFASCTPDEPCRVFQADSGGDPAVLQDLARTVLEHAGLPPGNNRWFLHDRSRGIRGWYELPAAEEFSHGTLVALVAAGRRFHPFPFPDPVIVPMARNFDEQLEVRHYFSDWVAAIRRDPGGLAELDRRHAEMLARQHAAADVINASYGIPIDLNSIRGRNWLRVWEEDHELLRDGSPLTWAEYTQQNTLESERTLRVWAAGNHDPETGVPAAGYESNWYRDFPNVLAGDGHRNLDALGPVYFPELRGQHISVTALSLDEERLARYADPCGELPADWNAGEFGRHFCLAAPGTLAEGVEGTSFAAPFVSGVLARMKERFDGVAPRELVRKLMDTADEWQEDGFDGGIYVVDENGDIMGSNVNIVPQDPTDPSPGYRVAQRGCRPYPGDVNPDYLVWTGNVGDVCVVWRKAAGAATAGEAEAAAAKRFAFVYGAGRVDVDRDDGAFAFVSPPQVSARGGQPAPVALTRLRTPSAWGALGDRLSGLSLVAFDAIDFPFTYRLRDFVSDAAGGSSPIPEFLPEPGRARACDPLRQLAPGLVCTPWVSETPTHALVSPDGAGATYRLGEGTLLSGFTRLDGRLDGAGSGALSFDGGSSLAALHLDRAWTVGGAGRWQLEGALTLAIDLPRGLRDRSPSIFEAGPALLSEWGIRVTRASGEARTRLSVSQPPRAESGVGRFAVPSGRREDHSRLYETHRVSLVPSHREHTLRLSHQRPLLGGDLVVSAHRTGHPGHRSARPEHGVGFAWRMPW